MDALFALQQDLFKQINNAFANFKKKGAAKMTRIVAQARLAGLEDHYSQYKVNHGRILTLKDLPQDHAYFTSNLSELLVDSYFERKGEFLQYIEDAQQAEKAKELSQVPVGLPQEVITTSASLGPHSLPKMNLPKFSGKFSEWENFRDLFRSVVHRRNDLEASIKYYYLRTNLSGEAMELIKAIPIAADQYDTAWGTLLAYYDNKRRFVYTLISVILGIKPMKQENEVELKRVSRDLFGAVESLRKLGRSEAEIGNDLIVHLGVELFDINTKKEWKKSIDKSNDSPPTVEQLKTFIKGQIETLDEGRENSKAKNNKGRGKTGNDSDTVHALQTNSKDNSRLKCLFCYAEHSLNRCDQFVKTPASERRKFVKSSRLCFNCLGSGHPQSRCRSKYSCFKCKRRHHTFLHVDNSENLDQHASQDSNDLGVSGSSQSTNCTSLVNLNYVHTAQIPKKSGVLLATALVRIQGLRSHTLTVRALIDPCSQISLITTDLCDRLFLETEHAHTRIQGVGEQKTLLASKLARFMLKPHFQSSFNMKTKALVINTISSYKPPTLKTSASLAYLNGLQLADPDYLENKQISLLLGADVFATIVENRIIKGPPSQPIATKSQLGWLLTGNITGMNAYSSSDTQDDTTVLNCSTTDEQLSNLLQGFWRAEELSSTKNPCSKEDEFCEEVYKEYTSRDSTGRYTVRLPWKDPDSITNVRIGESYFHAHRALKRLELNFAKDEKLKKEYTKFIREYIDLGHMTEIEETPSSASDFFFLPHHGVWKENSSTTKLRVVFNGSSRLSTGISLNDLLHSGPNLLMNPVDLVCSIRNYKIALSADVEKMFRMIGVDIRDRKFQVILWRFHKSEKIRIWILNTVTYGLTCSSYLAIRTLRQMASDHRLAHPVAAKIVEEEMYSDNVLTGAHTETEATAKVDELVNLFAKAQMNLRKWSTNKPQVLARLPEEMLEREKVTLFSADNSIPMLGIAWYTRGDYFSFHLADLDKSAPVTKRKVLSRIARTFDPLGWISPVIVTAKILMQLLWLQKIGWDDPLSAELAKEWFDWLDDLEAVREIKIPRWTGFTPGTSVELHGFADASKKAYGAVVYIRMFKDSSVSTSLQVAKSKVAPVKTLSIPRLELCASLLLARLVKQFIDASALTINDVHLWTDSADVLFWLRDQPSRWNTFVSNRCSEIHTSLPNAYWHHVKTKENPADIVSRGIEPSKLQANQLWWKGPAFLSDNLDPWSKKQDDLNFSLVNAITANTCVTAVELPKGEIRLQMGKRNEDLDEQVWQIVRNYSSLSKLLRVTAYCLRFLSKISSAFRGKNKNERKGSTLFLNFIGEKSNHVSLEISAVEMYNAELFWYYLVQRVFFQDEYRLLMRQKTLNRKSPLSTLYPIIENCLIRVGGRLENALGDYNAKHPVILPHSSTFTKLIIKRAHLLTLHGGTQLTLATLRQRVWIVRARAEVRRIIQSCVQCARYAKLAPSQLMGELPTARVQPSSPFAKSGVDYAGPLSVRLTKSRGKGTMKAYVCIFVCMVTKAVHLELAEDYSSEAFIGAFHRFTARRGHCKELYSDQGTNFVGANSELKTMLGRSSEFRKQISCVLAEEGTTWHFNPPSAPHFGGLWEAGVKSMKFHIRRVIGDQILTFSEFSTLLCRVEACLNSRPLVRLSDDVSDIDFLTPAHFLIQRASYLIPEPDITGETVPVGKRWLLISQMTQRFWVRWKNEYLTSLQSRSKWLHPKAELKRGDVVLIKSENSPPARWPLGKIVQVHSGRDNHVRVVTVRTAGGQMQRPIVKLVKLPVFSNSSGEN